MSADVRSDPDLAAEVAAWERSVIGWLRDQWGENIASVFRHMDEKHAHLHAHEKKKQKTFISDARMQSR